MTSLSNNNSDLPDVHTPVGKPLASQSLDRPDDEGASTAFASASGGDMDSQNPLIPGEPSAAVAARTGVVPVKGQWRWWLKLIVQPVIFALSVGLVFLFLGLAQQAGFLTTEEQDSSSAQSVSSESSETMYICPMMCVAPTTEPGRCPVCAMELVPAASAQKSDGISISIDSETRRILNIQTAPVIADSGDRVLRSVGELNYDESRLKTLSAYVDGRIEELHANYTGFEVSAGDRLALIYSPRLYSTQVEYLSSIKSEIRLRANSLATRESGGSALRNMARTRLNEQGMTDEQIDDLERGGEANSRLSLLAPISGTVIEKFAVEGQYVKEGDPIYRLADLSRVWLTLRLFPEDAALIREGQEVEAEVQSLPGESCLGRVSFIFPSVDPVSRTVNVRVELPNPEGRLRIGDYARANIRVPLSGRSDLANEAVGSEGSDGQLLMIPRSALLQAGQSSVVYVETEPGRFEIRPVTVGVTSGSNVVILSGLKAGEEVAIRGNFLIDSQMQLSGNASLIDPSRAIPETAADRFELTPEIELALAPLTPEDRALVIEQRICPVAEMPLGSMGTPIKVDVLGKPVFICCEGCRSSLLENPEVYFEVLKKYQEARSQKSGDSSPSQPDMGEAIVPDMPPMGEIMVSPPEENVDGGRDQ